ncbi:MAG: leucine-rich repeat protein [Oscillospiraceae bacterium]|nr:leucine-rich repeat protein [Oscillospiraceae bacterium]
MLTEDDAEYGVLVKVDEGTCGPAATWKLYTNGNLIIAGTGKMTDYELHTSPFYKYRDIIKVAYINGVTNIGAYAFTDCTALTDVSIPDTVKTIGKYAFEGCPGLEYVEIPDSVSVIDDFAFEYCMGLTGVDIPDNVSRIGKSAFEYCTGLQYAELPAGLITIDDRAFYGCSGLGSVEIPDGTDSIGAYAFCDCSGMTSVIIPDSVRTIGEHAFDGCSGLYEINLPAGIGKVSDGAFRGCSGVQSLVIPDNITELGADSFRDCRRLRYLHMPASVTTIGADAFTNDPLVHIHIPNGTTYEDYAGRGDLPLNEKYYYPLNKKGFCYDMDCPLGMPAYTDATVDATVNDTDTGHTAVLRSSDPDARIYYTLENRSTLTTDDPSVAPGGTIDLGNFYGSVYCRAYVDGAWGPVYRIIIPKPVVQKPSYSAVHAYGGRLFTFYCADADADIYYEIGTSAVTNRSNKVKSGDTIFIDQPGKFSLYCKSCKNGVWCDGVTKYGFNNIKIVTPRVVKYGKADDNKYRVFCNDAEAFVIYTLDGTTPEIEHGVTGKIQIKNGRIGLGTDNKWSNDVVITVPKGKTIKAIAIRSGLVDSDVVTYTT